MNKSCSLPFLAMLFAMQIVWADSKSLSQQREPMSLGQSIQQAPPWLSQTVYPDGLGLPAGSGTAQQGLQIFNKQCVSCHGEAGRGGSGGQLTGPILPKEVWAKSPRPSKHTGQYWPYATTLFDYIRRAMPYQAPGSLTDNEVYALTAYLLAQQKIITDDFILNVQTLPKVVMPNKDGFIRNSAR
jgi:cytochrome c